MKRLVWIVALLMIVSCSADSPLDMGSEFENPAPSYLSGRCSLSGDCLLEWTECSTPKQWEEYEIHWSLYPGITEWQVPENTYLTSTYTISDTTLLLESGLVEPDEIYYFAIRTIGKSGSSWSNEIWWSWSPE